MSDAESTHPSLPFRTEPAVVDPSVYLEHQLEAPFYFPSQHPEPAESADELIANLEEQLEAQEEDLTAEQLLEAIYHPDERVLLAVLKKRGTTGRHSSRNLPPLDLDDVSLRVRDLLHAFLTMGHGRKVEDAEIIWRKVRQEYYHKLDRQVRAQAWKRARQTAQTEGVLWNPLLDYVPREFPTKPLQKNFQAKLGERIQQLGQWAETAPPEQLEGLQKFRHPQLLFHLITERLHCFSPRQAGTFIRQLHEEGNRLNKKAARDTQLTRQHLIEITRTLLDSEKKASPAQLERLAQHPRAHSGLWKTILEAYEEHTDKNQRTVMPGGFHRCRRWMRHEPSRKQYLQLADQGGLRRALINLELPIDEVGDIAVRNHPEWVALFLLWEDKPPWRAHRYDKKLYPRMKNWLQNQPRFKLTPLLGVGDTEIRQRILIRLSEMETEQPYRPQAEGPGRNQPQPRTTPFQPREMS